MNSASFDTKVRVLKLDTNCKNYFINMNELFLSFRHRFVGLDENTPYHDYPNVLYRISH